VSWRPPVELSPAEQQVVKRIRRAKLFVLLRQRRRELFSEEFQAELAGVYADSAKGQPPVAPAQLALALIVQAYTGASDDEVIEATVMDRRWQLVLDCLDAEQPPFSKGTLFNFRTRLIEANLDRRLVEATVALAASPAAGRQLRAALDSSPLWGAGRVEDTYNLMGHALRKALGVIARQQGWGLAEGTVALAEQAGAGVLGASSLKAALDTDWDDLAARDDALGVVLAALEQVGRLWPPNPRRRRRPGRRWRRPARSVIRTCSWPPTAARACGGEWPRIGGSAWRTSTCVTAASRGRPWSTATSGTCSATWTAAWSPRSASRQPTRPRRR
jgi:Transposase domain (DUF772)